MSFTRETFCVAIQFRFEQSSRKKRKLVLESPLKLCGSHLLQWAITSVGYADGIRCAL